jgi:hypothetical protein
MHWSRKYLKIPYEKMNCSEYVEFVLRDHFKIDFTFPQNKGNVFSQSAQIKSDFVKFASAQKTDSPSEGDLVMMNGIRKMCHIGLLVKIKNVLYVLHNQKNIGSASLHKIKDLGNFGLTLEGVYKWQK